MTKTKEWSPEKWKVKNCTSITILEVEIYTTQCVKGPFFVQKLQIIEKPQKRSILIFVSKLTIFSSKKFEIFEFFRA